MARIRPQKFAHIVYRTRRFDQMLEWHQFVFDARVQYENPALALLTYDDEHHRFALANLDVLQPASKETGRQGLVGVDHVAYTYASLEDLVENSEDAGDYMRGPITAANPVGVEYDPEDWLARMRAGCGSGSAAGPAGTTDNAARCGAGMLAVPQYLLAVDEYVDHAGRILVRFNEGGVVADGRRVKNHHIGIVPLLQPPTPLDAEILRRQCGQFADRFLQCNDSFLAHVLAEDAGETSISPRMRVASQEHACRGQGSFV